MILIKQMGLVLTLLGVLITVPGCQSGNKGSSSGEAPKNPDEEINETADAETGSVDATGAVKLEVVEMVEETTEVPTAESSTNEKSTTKEEPTEETSDENQASPVYYDELEVLDQNGAATVGNGGDAIICFKPNTREVESVQLLDYYEAKNRWNFTLDLGDKNLSVEEKLEHVISRLAKVDPDRAKYYRKEVAFFFANSNFWKGIRLNNINDSNHVGVQNGCVLGQVARQHQSQLEFDKYYIIASDIYDLMDNDNKAGLILHEIVYKEMIQKAKHTESSKARQFNGLISSVDISALSFETYVSLIDDANLPLTYGGLGLNLKEDKITYEKDGSISSVTTFDERSIFIANEKILVNTGGVVNFEKDDQNNVIVTEIDGLIDHTIMKKTVVFHLGDESKIKFDYTGSIVSIENTSLYPISCKNEEIKISLDKLSFDVVFSESGQIATVSAPSGNFPWCPGTGNVIYLKKLVFSDLGIPEWGIQGRGELILQNKSYTLAETENYSVYFYEDGSLKNVNIDGEFDLETEFGWTDSSDTSYKTHVYLNRSGQWKKSLDLERRVSGGQPLASLVPKEGQSILDGRKIDYESVYLVKVVIKDIEKIYLLNKQNPYLEIKDVKEQFADLGFKYEGMTLKIVYEFYNGQTIEEIMQIDGEASSQLVVLDPKIKDVQMKFSFFSDHPDSDKFYRVIIGTKSKGQLYKSSLMRGEDIMQGMQFRYKTFSKFQHAYVTIAEYENQDSDQANYFVHKNRNIPSSTHFSEDSFDIVLSHNNKVSYAKPLFYLNMDFPRNEVFVGYITPINTEELRGDIHDKIMVYGNRVTNESNTESFMLPGGDVFKECKDASLQSFYCLTNANVLYVFWKGDLNQAYFVKQLDKNLTFNQIAKTDDMEIIFFDPELLFPSIEERKLFSYQVHEKWVDKKGEWDLFPAELEVESGDEVYVSTLVAGLWDVIYIVGNLSKGKHYFVGVNSLFYGVNNESNGYIYTEIVLDNPFQKLDLVKRSKDIYINSKEGYYYLGFDVIKRNPISLDLGSDAVSFQKSLSDCQKDFQYDPMTFTNHKESHEFTVYGKKIDKSITIPGQMLTCYPEVGNFNKILVLQEGQIVLISYDPETFEWQIERGFNVYMSRYWLDEFEVESVGRTVLKTNQSLGLVNDSLGLVILY